ncbi:MAG: hypothetical protein MUC58_09715 [Rhizobiaceae bacterium]|jgi:hypothetical protein|nr:hypothetical protein [Rhizobiaceae bacterium]
MLDILVSLAKWGRDEAIKAGQSGDRRKLRLLRYALREFLFSEITLKYISDFANGDSDQAGFEQIRSRLVMRYVDSRDGVVDAFDHISEFISHPDLSIAAQRTLADIMGGKNRIRDDIAIALHESTKGNHRDVRQMVKRISELNAAIIQFDQELGLLT